MKKKTKGRAIRYFFLLNIKNNPKKFVEWKKKRIFADNN